jgi:hypothetical protein
MTDLTRALLSVMQDYGDSWKDFMELIMAEIVDGQRNLIHVAIDKLGKNKYSG